LLAWTSRPYLSRRRPRSSRSLTLAPDRLLIQTPILLSSDTYWSALSSSFLLLYPPTVSFSICTAIYPSFFVPEDRVSLLVITNFDLAAFCGSEAKREWGK
jgi:hypothetical protein